MGWMKLCGSSPRIVCVTVVAVAFLLLPSAIQRASAATTIYLDWQVENPGAGGRLEITNYPAVLENGQTYKVDMTFTLEWIDWGDRVQFQKIYWLFDDGGRDSPLLGYSVAHSNLTKDVPLTVSAYWSLQQTPLNATGVLQIDANVTVINATLGEIPRSPINLKLIPSVKISHKTESTLNLTLSSRSIRRGDIVTVTGNLTPTDINATIDLTYTPPTGDAVKRRVATDGSGGFRDDYQLAIEGGWSVQAAWAGDDYHLASKSSILALRVEPPNPIYKYIILCILVSFGVIALVLTWPSKWPSKLRSKSEEILPRDSERAR